jgi:tRNA-guanine family transglycosylase
VGDVLGTTLASIHNIHWFQSFMARMRLSILEGRFQAFRETVWTVYPEKTVAKSKSPPKKSRGNRGGRK